MAIQLMQDGSLISSEPLALRGYLPDPANSNRYIPKFQKCKHRLNKCGMSPCGQRLQILWHCNLFNTRTGPIHCQGCSAREE